MRKKFLAEFVYGATDGTVTTFAVISGSIGASLGIGVVLILGFANLFADGLSMALSNYLSVKSSNDLALPQDRKNPIKTSLATFVSFVSVGFIPLIPFVISRLHPWILENQFSLSIVMTGIAFFMVGFIKGEVVRKHKIYSAIETLMIGALAASIAFLVGYLLKGLSI